MREDLQLEAPPCEEPAPPPRRKHPGLTRLQALPQAERLIVQARARVIARSPRTNQQLLADMELHGEQIGLEGTA